MSWIFLINTAQKMKFCIKDFCSKCEQIQDFLRIWSRLLKKPLLENFIFCTVKYPWVDPLKDKKCIAITYTFQKNLDESNHKPNKIWVDKGSEFQNR